MLQRPPSLASSLSAYLNLTIFFRFFVGNGPRRVTARGASNLQFKLWFTASSMTRAQHPICRHWEESGRQAASSYTT